MGVCGVKLAAEQAAARAARAQAAHAELASMRSAAQSEATALNEAKIAHFTTEVRYWAARIARTHDGTRALLSLKRQLRHGALECASSHVHATVHDGTADMSDEDVRRALARARADLHSQQARHDTEQELLASERHQQERWRHESPSTDALYEYIVLLADCWLHSLAQPVNTAVSTAAQVEQLREKWPVAGPYQNCPPRPRSLQAGSSGSGWYTRSLRL